MAQIGVPWGKTTLTWRTLEFPKAEWWWNQLAENIGSVLIFLLLPFLHGFWSCFSLTFPAGKPAPAACCCLSGKQVASSTLLLWWIRPLIWTVLSVMNQKISKAFSCIWHSYLLPCKTHFLGTSAVLLLRSKQWWTPGHIFKQSRKSSLSNFLSPMLSVNQAFYFYEMGRFASPHVSSKSNLL